MLTSGTTGAAKRVPLRRAQLEASLAAALQHNNRPEATDKPPLTGAVGMVTLPIVHIGGLWALLQSLVAARPIVMLERFSLSGLAHRDQGTPAHPGRTAAARDREVLNSDIPREDLASVRAINSGTAPVDPVLVDAFVERYGIPILITYGATEFSGAVAGWTLKDFHARGSTRRAASDGHFPACNCRWSMRAARSSAPGRPAGLQVGLAAGRREPETGSPPVISRISTTMDTSTSTAVPTTSSCGAGSRSHRRRSCGRCARTRCGRRRRGRGLAGRRGWARSPLPQSNSDPRWQQPMASLRAHCRATLTPYEVPAQVFVVDELPRGAALKVDRRRLVATLEKLAAG